MCAIDALGIPAMLGADVVIFSTYPVTGEAVTVTTRGGAAVWEPEGVVVFVGQRPGGGPAATACCDALNFFASTSPPRLGRRTTRLFPVVSSARGRPRRSRRRPSASCSPLEPVVLQVMPRRRAAGVYEGVRRLVHPPEVEGIVITSSTQAPRPLRYGSSIHPPTPVGPHARRATACAADGCASGP
ncbi:organomercurial lyase [Streptomyces sp. NPDC002187]|uniref:organomercurial lyase n=1 Tax=Streptomyces sp. NPDC002187 TaxID=3364637 RepID=UPI0036A4ADA8